MEAWKTSISTHIRMKYEELERDLLRKGLRTKDYFDPDLEGSLGTFVLRLDDLIKSDAKHLVVPRLGRIAISEKIFEDLKKNGFFSKGFEGPTDTPHELEIVVIDHPKAGFPRNDFSNIFITTLYSRKSYEPLRHY